jgi:sugar/nucleoside kinase (ribokinase family)
MPRYISIGNLTIDRIVLPDGQEVSRQCGGDCLYAAVGIRVWGGGVGIVSVIGADYPAGWLQQLIESQIDVSGIRQTVSPHKLAGTMVYRTDGERIAEYLGTNPSDQPSRAEWLSIWDEFSPASSDIPESYIGTDGAHIAAMPVDRQDDCLETLHWTSKRMTLDLGPKEPGEREFPGLALPSAVLLSQAEVSSYFGDSSPREAALGLAGSGAKVVAVKLGAQGSTVYAAAAGGWWSIPAFKTTVRDLTGAGDAYCGGFLVGLDETGDPLQAALYGTVSASFVIEEFGALYALKFSRDDAETRLRTLRSMIPG